MSLLFVFLELLQQCKTSLKINFDINFKKQLLEHSNPITAIIVKGTKVQTLGGRAVAGAWCMAGCLGARASGHGCNYERLKLYE